MAGDSTVSTREPKVSPRSLYPLADEGADPEPSRRIDSRSDGRRSVLAGFAGPAGANLREQLAAVGGGVTTPPGGITVLRPIGPTINLPPVKFPPLIPIPPIGVIPPLEAPALPEVPIYGALGQSVVLSPRTRDRYDLDMISNVGSLTTQTATVGALELPKTIDEATRLLLDTAVIGLSIVNPVYAKVLTFLASYFGFGSRCEKFEWPGRPVGIAPFWSRWSMLTVIGCGAEPLSIVGWGKDLSGSYIVEYARTAVNVNDTRGNPDGLFLGPRRVYFVEHGDALTLNQRGEDDWPAADDEGRVSGHGPLMFEMATNGQDDSGLRDLRGWHFGAPSANTEPYPGIRWALIAADFSDYALVLGVRGDEPRVVGVAVPEDLVSCWRISDRMGFGGGPPDDKLETPDPNDPERGKNFEFYPERELRDLYTKYWWESVAEQNFLWRAQRIQHRNGVFVTTDNVVWTPPREFMSGQDMWGCGRYRYEGEDFRRPDVEVLSYERIIPGIWFCVAAGIGVYHVFGRWSGFTTRRNNQGWIRLETEDFPAEGRLFPIPSYFPTEGFGAPLFLRVAHVAPGVANVWSGRLEITTELVRQPDHSSKRRLRVKGTGLASWMISEWERRNNSAVNFVRRFPNNVNDYRKKIVVHGYACYFKTFYQQEEGRLIPRINPPDWSEGVPDPLVGPPRGGYPAPVIEIPDGEGFWHYWPGIPSQLGVDRYQFVINRRADTAYLEETIKNAIRNHLTISVGVDGLDDQVGRLISVIPTPYEGVRLLWSASSTYDLNSGDWYEITESGWHQLVINGILWYELTQ